MSEQEKGTADKAEANGDENAHASADDSKSARAKMGDGIKQGIGVLSAFKDAIEETIQEARDRGDLSTERAKEVMKEALDKAQTVGERARDRLDFANQTEVDSLKGAMQAVRQRLSNLEESVFGSSKDDDKHEEKPASEDDSKDDDA